MISGVTSAQTSATGLPADGISEWHGLVSVVINFFNEERFLAEAVDSVYAQTFHDWELLLIDDGSSDRSSDIARGYAEHDPARVRYLEHPGHANRGAGASRNVGVHAARGEWVAFLDGDDIWLPERLERSVALAAGAPGCGHGLRKDGVLVELARHAARCRRTISSRITSERIAWCGRRIFSSATSHFGRHIHAWEVCWCGAGHSTR